MKKGMTSLKGGDNLMLAQSLTPIFSILLHLYIIGAILHWVSFFISTWEYFFYSIHEEEPDFPFGRLWNLQLREDQIEIILSYQWKTISKFIPPMLSSSFRHSYKNMKIEWRNWRAEKQGDAGYSSNIYNQRRRPRPEDVRRPSLNQMKPRCNA